MKILKQLPDSIMEAIKNNNLSKAQLAQLLVSGSISNHLEKSFHSISPIYHFTTEPIDYYLKDIDFNGKDILTVAASGDHLLSSINKGASFVSTFDISLLTEFYQELKVAALLKLNYKDFLDFFAGKKAFDNDIYDEIRSTLSNYSLTFWDALFNYYEGYDIIHSQLFINEVNTKDIATIYNPYLKNDDEYYKTRENLKKTRYNFYNLDVLKLPISLVKQFDVILLSNIPDYVNEMRIKPNELANFFRKNMTSLLKEEGLIITTSFNYEISEQKGCDWELKKLNEVISTLTFRKEK